MARNALLLSALLVLTVGAGAWGAHQGSGRFVPLSPQWPLYSGREHVTFVVKECAHYDGLGGFAAGELLRAAREAAHVWQRVFSRVRIEIQKGSCVTSPPGENNGKNEIYWTSYLRPGVFGSYEAYNDGMRLVEEELRFGPENIFWYAQDLGTDRDTALFNALVHELGHALGLADAYLNWPQGCGWSVMLALCTRGRITPTTYDLEALAHIYGAPSGAPGPTSPDRDQLAQFDTDQDGVIDDEELFTAVDRWIAREIGDELLFALIDAWTSKRRIRSAGLERPDMSENSSIDIYDLNGRRVYHQGCRYGQAGVRARQVLESREFPNSVYLVVLRDCESGAWRIHKITKLD